MLDLVVRNALIYDGSGMPPFLGEVGVKGGRIVRVGRVPEQGGVELDAGGHAVSPGFIDVHTHFDAQVCWDGLAQPELEHGVTTVVTGNCSLTIAPLHAGQRDRLCRMFRQIEDLPMAAFEEGIDWQWESFSGWLGALQGKIGINLAPLVGHSALRMWVMGEDAFHRQATADEVAAMQVALEECVDAGASGMSTSYIDVDHNFKPVPSRLANHDELQALCATLGTTGHGILQVVHEFYDTAKTVERVDMLGDLSLEYGIPTTLAPLFHNQRAPEMVPTVLGRIEEQARRGARVWPQVQVRPIDINFRLRERNFMLAALPAWGRVFGLPDLQQKIAAFSDPDTRAQLVSEAMPGGDQTELVALRRRLDDAYIRGVARPEHLDLVGRRLGDLAEERGTTVVDVMIDIALSEDLQTEFKNDGLGHIDVQPVGEMLSHPNVLIGASDAGAHVQAFATYGDTGYLFSQFVRSAGVMRTEQAVRRLTLEPALAWGLRDRGLLNPGYAADMVVFDPDTIARGDEVGASDLPGDGFRYIRHSVGVDTVIVNGEVTWSADTGYSAARAGQVVSLSTPARVG